MRCGRLRWSVRQRRAFQTTGAGVPPRAESKKEQEDARNYVMRTDWRTHVHPDWRLKFQIPSEWHVTMTGPTLNQAGETLVEFHGSHRDSERPTPRMTQNPLVGHTFAVSTMRYPLHSSSPAGMLRADPRKMQQLWFTQYEEAMKIQAEAGGQGPRDIVIHRNSFPCTPMDDDDPQGSWAWSTCTLHPQLIPAVQYWRVFFHPDEDQFYVCCYTSSKMAAEDHLAQRWFGLYMVSNVEAM
eukprot:TRINITY_DN71939_c0_g1_i1.p1 TRINITY_DN71939_c0_g1~~TRINITY_DN71939_c0_g1_i1.p1  ORF type:complete len:265 (+),score=76.25 TRINITY_DN71939_c0_g1_i1:78-797(+)